MRRLKMAISVAAAGALAAAIITAATNASAATLFSDDFNDGNASGWSTSGGSWSVTSGFYNQSGSSADAKAQAGSTSWTAQSVSARVRVNAFGSNANRAVGVVARAQSTSNFYAFVLTPSGVQLRRGGTVLASGALSVVPGQWVSMSLTATGSSLTGSAGGTTITATDGAIANGRTGFVSTYASGSFDDLVVSDTPGPQPSGNPTSNPPSSPPPPGTCNTSGSPTGFGAGTTGGAGGPKIEVDTASELLAAIGQSGPLQICVRGMITVPAGMHNVTSNKSIVGIGNNSGITGGGFNIGLPVSEVTSPPANAVNNVIIRNMVFRGATDDSINVQMFSHHIWIDHNDLASGYDGLIDIKRGSSFITVSWNHTHHHTKNMLLGHDDSNGPQDIGRLKVSYHHNWFDATPQRNPRVRFGEPVHVYNNYFFYNTDTGVACQANAGCVVEGNYFDNVEEPVTNSYAGPGGRCVARNNFFAGESGQADCSGSVQEPSSYYSYTLDNPADVKAIVTAGAGVGKI